MNFKQFKQEDKSLIEVLSMYLRNDNKLFVENKDVSLLDEQKENVKRKAIVDSNFFSVVKKNTIDATAMYVVATPIYAFAETFLLGLNDATSKGMRWFSIWTAYLGVASALSFGRDYSRKKLHITDESNELVQTTNDNTYSGSIGLVGLIITPLVCKYFDVPESSQVFWTTVVETGLATTLVGALSYYNVDFFRDLTGLKESARVPTYLKNKSSGFKTRSLAAIMLLSMGLTAGVYSVPQDLKDKSSGKFYEVAKPIFDAGKNEVYEFMQYYYDAHARSDASAKPTKPQTI
jgi:hypothetical protein